MCRTVCLCIVGYLCVCYERGSRVLQCAVCLGAGGADVCECARAPHHTTPHTSSLGGWVAGGTAGPVDRQGVVWWRVGGLIGWLQGFGGGGGGSGRRPVAAGYRHVDWCAGLLVRSLVSGRPLLVPLAVLLPTVFVVHDTYALAAGGVSCTAQPQCVGPLAATALQAQLCASILLEVFPAAGLLTMMVCLSLFGGQPATRTTAGALIGVRHCVGVC